MSVIFLTKELEEKEKIVEKYLVNGQFIEETPEKVKEMQKEIEDFYDRNYQGI
ncbi:MAG: hypothetical protein KHZ87_06690 [Clostridiales bacterium]|nr:hypothetical protein [Clostridiales bacterium]MBS5877013.1 hypothetical protein [Clostridiales bacterium]MDU0940081.1 hypothetical protein [Clostridiales bacterium]MDU1041723.1 hypothetical protein [Clostridiales bacterium]MDU3490335.1 hypothetical protein [Clostridiales bacterium]